MGMFDYLNCKYPLPNGANGCTFQTKDTEAQFLDHYEIREDGTLWHEEYDLEDRSDTKAEGFSRLFGIRTRVNPRWTQSRMTGEVRFYTDRDDWIEFSAYFIDGELKFLQPIKT